MTSVPTGCYRHYKGKEYTVLGVARHSETQEELVVYRQEYGDHSLWVRPATMFLEVVESGGGTVPRFQACRESHDRSSPHLVESSERWLERNESRSTRSSDFN